MKIEDILKMDDHDEYSYEVVLTKQLKRKLIFVY